jgi:hypothetical protein
MLPPNAIQNSENVHSVYQTPELEQRLASYNSPDALVAFDIAGTIRRAPEMAIVIGHLQPWRWHRWMGKKASLSWTRDFSADLVKAAYERWSPTKIESHAIAYAVERVMPEFDPEQLEEIAMKESPPFFKGFEPFFESYTQALTALVSRGLPPIVADNKESLGADQAYSLVTDKTGLLKTIMKRHGLNKLLYAGDLPLDIEAALEVEFTDDGYQVDIIHVTKKPQDAHGHATIWIPRDWTGLAELRPTLELVPYGQELSQLA